MMKMNKKLVVLIAAIMFTAAAGIQFADTAFGAVGDDLYKGKEQLKREKEQRMQQEQAQNENQSAPIGDYSNVTDEEIFGSADELPVYYPNATLKSAVTKYKNNNYTGCIQELYSILKKDKNNSTAYYYLAMSYIKVGKKDQAQAAYTKVINLNRNDILVDYSIKGIDCLNGAPSCVGGSSSGDQDDLDKFISAPYGNGFSEQVNTEWKKKQLKYIQNKINKGGTLTPEELQKFNELNKSETIKTEKLAFADNGSKKNSEMPSNDEIIDALNVLKRAGLNISTQVPTIETPSEQTAIQPQIPVQNPMAYTPDPQIQQMSMMLNGGNNNTPDPMMYMVPYMMNANNGQNIDPKVLQSMMMNSMMNSLNGMNAYNNNN